jgi:uncharacterized protein DUF3800
MAEFNIYCDESCHLEADQDGVMVLGALLCPRSRVRAVAKRLRDVKRAHGMGHDHPERFEVKWSKVSASGYEFYRDYVDVLFQEEDLSFRSLIVPDKSILRHADFGQTHDDWYYKMYYRTLEPLLSSAHAHDIYLDIKDTLSQRKVLKLGEVLRNSLHDFDRTIVTGIQHVRSDEVEQVQLVDLLIGAIGYLNRGLSSNPGKNSLIAFLQERAGLTLRVTTGRNRRPVNVFVWHPGDPPGV